MTQNDQNMEVSELVKIKPGTIIWVGIEERVIDEDEDRLVVANEQEVCLKVESLLYIPSRKDPQRIQLNFSPIELSGDTESTTLDHISIWDSRIGIGGSTLCRDGDETWCSDVSIKSIELE